MWKQIRVVIFLLEKKKASERIALVTPKTRGDLAKKRGPGG
jgi:hypothetical protein